MNIKKLLILSLKEVLFKLEEDTCEIDNDTALQLISVFAHLPLSKAEAYSELGISRSKFDNLVSKGILPPGHKRIGFNELSWYKDEILLKYKNYIDGK